MFVVNCRLAGAETVTLLVSPLPCTTKLCAAEVTPCAVVKLLNAPVIVSEEEGAGVTVPLTETFAVNAPLETATLPEGLPSTAPVKRTETVVGETNCATGIVSAVDENVVPLVDTANPAGGAMTTSLPRFAAVMAKV